METGVSCNCSNCGWSESLCSSIMCHYTGYSTFRDECCEAWKSKAEERGYQLKEEPRIVLCKDCKYRGEVMKICLNDKIPCYCATVDDYWFCASGKRRKG